MAIRVLAACWLLLTTTLSFANTDALRIGVGDALLVEVYNEPDLRVRAKVPESGRLRFPLVGDVSVIDQTPEQLAEQLETLYLDGYLVSPSVSVLIESFRPYFVRGAVKSAGSFTFQMDLSVEKAIAVAGGLKDRASKSAWFVIRADSGERIKASKDTRIYPGDIVEIEESLF
ncbi:polysaccharide biosynthesis/export family protein [Aestuariibacter salexigens]|uniref:polysaccharide biosynthesis/export family protein n=1 Tax=Aestuariibacter salexigens TaxID=226010 RepID=UPI001F0B21D8|nr:polysaccharide biosynthesis/export family protein [Aestuariibacter salexigens]